MTLEAADAGPRARDAWPVAALLLIGFVLRLTWWHYGVQVIENEGTNYARLGENIAAGRGYLGLDELGPQLIYPPLYPALIAAGIKAGAQSDVAGRVASLAFGTLAIALFASIGRRMFGRRAGLAAGAIAAFHPLLIVASVAVLAESTYLLLAVLGIYLAIEQLSLPRPSTALWCGIVLGVAYLCRPEALLLGVAIAVLIVITDRAAIRRATASAGLLLAGLALFAVPYVLYLHQQTGQWRFEAKSPQGVIYQAGAWAGRSTGDLYWGIDEKLDGRGLSNTSDIAQAQFNPPPLAVRMRIAAHQVIANVPELLRGLAHPQFGGIFLGMIVGLGLFGATWNADRFKRELPWLALVTLVIAPYLIWPFTLDRSLFMLLAPLVVWGSYGLSRLAGWTRDAGAALGMPTPGRAVLSVALIGVVVGPMLATSWFGVRATDEMAQSSSNLAEYAPIGRWLGSLSPRARIADSGPTVAYYADAVLVRFPWCDGPTALRYLERNKVSFVVLRENALESRPYLGDWFRDAPAGEMELVKSFTGTVGTTKIYRWKHSTESTLEPLLDH